MAVRTLEYKRPDWLYDKQGEAIFDPSRYVVIEASTKSGKTVGCIAWLIERAIIDGGVGREFWWVAPIYAQAKIAYRRVKRYLKRQHYTKNDSDLRIMLPNGSVLMFKGSDNPDSLYGEDVFAAVIDEASRCKEEAWVAVRSTLTATRGPIRIIGNVKGKKNWAYRLGRKAKAGAEGFAYYRITAVDAVRAGVLVLDEILDAQGVLLPEVFDELFMAVATDDGSNPFGLDAIRNCVVGEMPDTEPVVWGWDLARKRDWTVGIALDEHRRVCRFERFQRPWPETIHTILEDVGGLTAFVDGTGVGDAIVGQLQEKSASDNFVSFVFTSKSKQQLMEGLAHDIQAGDVYIMPGVLQDEMESFEYSYTRTGVTYSAPEGMHDDAVCALALAIRAFKEGPHDAAKVW